FEEAARLRDEIRRLEAVELGLDAPGMSQAAATTTGPSGTGLPPADPVQHASDGQRRGDRHAANLPPTVGGRPGPGPRGGIGLAGPGRQPGRQPV
ncbi:MAG: hypothetical protein EB136_07230, partial [Synechococcaceae bacterium WBB_3_034]|nr:hypothetical protein [Synechococcaceae bacterium WBB_3_034]